MARRPPLSEYRKKRRFDVTSEPAGRAPAATPRRRALRFVVHKHRATQLHYDLRLEWDGVLRSWAVPKGPSLDPSVKRLAMAVEDHPLEYAKFEGVIPEGEYGGGTVMLWDRGTWSPESPDIASSLERGELKFALAGKKLRGSFVLVRTRGRPGGGGDGRSWLLIKHADEFASRRDVTDAEPRSVRSGRILAEIAAAEGGDVTKAASGDPEREVRALLRRLEDERGRSSPAAPRKQPARARRAAASAAGAPPAAQKSKRRGGA